MKVKRTRKFKKDYRRLAKVHKRRVEKTIEQLLMDKGHPALHIHRMKYDFDGCWSASVTTTMRVLFHIHADHLELLRVVKHDLVEHSK